MSATDAPDLSDVERDTVKRFGLDQPETLAERVDRRLRVEWPGMHMTKLRGLFEVAPIRAGGATDALLSLVRKIIAEESVVRPVGYYRMGRRETATGQVYEISLIDDRPGREDKLLPHGQYRVGLLCDSEEVQP